MQQDEEKSSAEVSFLTDDEKDFIAKLRVEFKDELNKRLAEGRHYEAYFGDIAFCRICQSCEGNLDLGKMWLWRWLHMATTFNFDSLYAEVYEIWKQTESAMVSEISILPYYEEVCQYNRIVYCMPNLTPEGDMVGYMPMSDQDKQGVLAGLDWDSFVKFQRSMLILRALDLDRLSRVYKRLVKVVWVCDLEGCSLDSLSNSTFDRMQARDVSQFAECMACEVVRKFYIVNAPWAVSALHNLVKAFMPEKFSRKTAFTSGNGLRDSELLELTGGEEQLQAMYATRAGLVSKSIHLKKVYQETLDTFPSEEEQEIIEKLRTRFKDEFEKRKAEGRDYQSFFGDLALLRVVRGNGGCLGPAVSWFTRFLQRVKEHKLDDLIEEMTKRLDHSGGHFGSAAMLPYHDEIKEHSRVIYTAPRLSPCGDVISYFPLGDHHRERLLAEVPWEHWARNVLGNVVLRCIECDRLSRVQKRLVRFIMVVDLEGCGMGVSGMPSVPEFDMRQKLELEPLIMEISAEVMKSTYVLNAPWLAVKAYNFYRMLVPERISRKVKMVDGDGRSDHEFVKSIGGEAQLQQFIASRVGLVAGVMHKPTGSQEIAAGGEFHKSQEVQPGQRVEWKFSVESGSADDWFGASDIAFSATAFWYPMYPFIRDTKREMEADSKQAEDVKHVEVVKEEGSLEFDGEGGFVQMTEVPSFEHFTWSAWVKPSHECWWNEHTIIRRADQICLNCIDGSLRLWLHDGHWHCAAKASWDLAFTDTWHHLAATYDGQSAKIFVNGALVAMSPLCTKLSETINRVLIGAGLDYADRYFFKGQITEVRLHSVALPAKEISVSMRKRIDPSSESDLVGYAQLCGGVGFAQRQGILLQNNIGKVAARSYHGGATFASSQTPFCSPAPQPQVAVAASGVEAAEEQPADAAIPQLESSPSPVEVLVPQAVVSTGKQICGRYDAHRAGIITLKWSNAHSRMRSKMLHYSLEVSTVADAFSECEDGECSEAESLSSAPGPPAEERQEPPPPGPRPPPRQAPPRLDAPELAALHERASRKISEEALPEVRAARAVVDLALSFQEEGGPDAVYMLDE